MIHGENEISTSVDGFDAVQWKVLRYFLPLVRVALEAAAEVKSMIGLVMKTFEPWSLGGTCRYP